jgi:hypothetical protein
MKALADLVAALTAPLNCPPNYRGAGSDYPVAMWRGLAERHPALRQAQAILAQSAPPTIEPSDTRATICALPRKTPSCAHARRTNWGGRDTYYCHLTDPAACKYADPTRLTVPRADSEDDADHG